MHRRHLDLLVCPACRSDRALELEVARTDGDDIVAGRLSCGACGRAYAVENGVPRFVAAEGPGFGNFAFQWNRWRAIQIDRLSGHGLSARRFFADTGWQRSWLAGRLVLDAGCGAGRFADIAAGAGALVVACDISAAIDACRDNTRIHGERVLCLQASLYDLPLRPRSFDGVYCMGVIQHTPDPAAAMRALPRFLAPGGRLVYNFYEAGPWARLQLVKYGLRLVTPRLPVAWTLALSRALVGLLFPLTRALNRIRFVRIANHFLPIAATHPPELSRAQQYAWTLLETFDWYAPRYEYRQRHRRVMALLRDLGMERIEGAPGLVRATAPATGERAGSA